VNEWLIAAAVLVASLLPLQWIAFRGHPSHALVAMNQAGLVVVAVLMLLAEAFSRSPFMEQAEVLALLAFLGSLAFARFFERWV
jgi:multisubunit Na+/H+ antiporter MnhF subunit